MVLDYLDTRAAILISSVNLPASAHFIDYQCQKPRCLRPCARTFFCVVKMESAGGHNVTPRTPISTTQPPLFSSSPFLSASSFPLTTTRLLYSTPPSNRCRHWPSGSQKSLLKPRTCQQHLQLLLLCSLLFSPFLFPSYPPTEEHIPKSFRLRCPTENPN